MAQEEIYTLLKSNPGKEYSSTDIKEIFPHLSAGTINVNLKRLTRCNEVYRKLDERSPRRAYIYWYFESKA